MRIFAPIQRPTLRELFVELPKTGAILFAIAITLATIMTAALTMIRQTVTYYTPAEHYMKVTSVRIPDVDYRASEHGEVRFRRVVQGRGLVAEWYSEIVVYNDAGREQCRRSGKTLYQSGANNVTITVPVMTWLGEGCALPAGCYYQDLQWEFEVDGIRKSTHATSNKFAVTTDKGHGICLEG